MDCMQFSLELSGQNLDIMKLTVDIIRRDTDFWHVLFLHTTVEHFSHPVRFKFGVSGCYWVINVNPVFILDRRASGSV
jgi:hypothetical protein